jgi:hypothetical protein
MKKEPLKTIISEMVDVYLNESAKLTNGESLKIGKEAKKMAEKIKKGGGSLADSDASYLENFASLAFNRDLKMMTRQMDGGETANREDVFEVVSKIIGKDRAQHLSRGKY